MKLWTSFRLYPATISCGRQFSLLKKTHVYHYSQKSKNKKQKSDKEKQDDVDKPDNSTSSGFMGWMQDAMSWANKASKEMMEQQTEQLKKNKTKKDQAQVTQPDENEKWIEMYKEIQESNKWIISIDEFGNSSEYTLYYKISGTEFMHRGLMKFNYYPLKYDEFMIGAYEGFKFILECLQSDNINALNNCVNNDVIDTIDDIKEIMLDDEYKAIGKIMLYLKYVDNKPFFKESSIHTKYTVSYYYQLIKHKDDVDTKQEIDTENKDNENNDDNQNDDLDSEEEYIQKRADLQWTSTWLPGPGWTFVIADDGWIVNDIECVDIPKKGAL